MSESVESAVRTDWRAEVEKCGHAIDDEAAADSLTDEGYGDMILCEVCQRRWPITLLDSKFLDTSWPETTDLVGPCCFGPGWNGPGNWR